VIFINAQNVGKKGFIFIRLTAAASPATRKRRAAGSSSYSASAAVYAPRVWDEATESWIPSSQVEVSKL